MVVYNGSEPWNVATDLGSLIGDLDSSEEIYRPQLRYRLVDEAAYPRGDLAALNSPVGDLFSIEKSRDWMEVRASVHRLRQSIPPTEASLRQAFETWLRKVILPRFIREEGRQEGREEGRQEGEARVVLRLLRLKFGTLDPEIETRVYSADADRLLGWSERILTAGSLQDVFRE